MPQRLPPPWIVTPASDECLKVCDANGFYFGGREVVGTNPDKLTRDQARRVAANIAKLPTLLAKD